VHLEIRHTNQYQRGLQAQKPTPKWSLRILKPGTSSRVLDTNGDGFTDMEEASRSRPPGLRLFAPCYFRYDHACAEFLGKVTLQHVALAEPTKKRQI
jgi:hypothetical protein